MKSEQFFGVADAPEGPKSPVKYDKHPALVGAFFLNDIAVFGFDNLAILPQNADIVIAELRKEFAVFGIVQHGLNLDRIGGRGPFCQPAQQCQMLMDHLHANGSRAHCGCYALD